jgi:hypothetical protein
LGIAAPIVPFGPAAEAAPAPIAKMQASAESPDRAKVSKFMIASALCAVYNDGKI